MKGYSDIPSAPKAVGPYSVAMQSRDMFFLSGQIPLDPFTGKIVDGGIEEQTRQVLKNIGAVLDGLDLDYVNIAKTTIFLTDLANFQTVNKIYQEVMGDHKPARSTIQISALPMGAMVEIEAIAVRE